MVETHHGSGQAEAPGRLAMPAHSAPAASPGDAVRVVIRPSRGWVPLSLGAVWRHRELVYFLIWRDVKVRYKQTTLGVLWALLQPALMMIVFTVVFGRVARLPSDGHPYALFVYCAIVPWSFFAQAMSQSANSLVESARLISKVAFPRLVIPLAAALSALVDFGASLVLLLVLMAVYGGLPGPACLALPLFVVLPLLSALAAGIWLAALNVQYRDVRYTLPFLVQIWFFATPVAYSAHLFHGPWRDLLGLNPLAGAIAGWRWALLGDSTPDALMLGLSTAGMLLLLVSGLYYFRRMERQFADVV